MKKFWGLTRSGSRQALAAMSFRAERGIPLGISPVEKLDRGIPRAKAALGMTTLRQRHGMAMLRVHQILKILKMVALQETRQRLLCRSGWRLRQGMRCMEPKSRSFGRSIRRFGRRFRLRERRGRSRNYFRVERRQRAACGGRAH